MKHFLWYLLLGFLFVYSCSTYDDTALRNEINSLSERISALETVQSAYDNNLTIKSVTQTDDGYVITFSDGSSATIHNGKDGTDGKNGDTWIKDLEIGDMEVTFYLTDDSSFSIPLYAALSIELNTENVVIAPDSKCDIGYVVTSNLSTILVETIAEGGIKAKVVPEESNMEGIIHIEAGSNLDEYAKVLVFVSNGEKVIMRKITIEALSISVDNDPEVEVSDDGGTIELHYISNINCEVHIPAEAQSWISVSETKAVEERLIYVNVTANEGRSRSATVIIGNEEGLHIEYTIEQCINKNVQKTIEREALIAIYNATGGDNWTNKTNWGSDKPLNEWFGVTVNHDGNVTEISLDENNLTGAIPTSIGDLSNLKKFSVYNNWNYEGGGNSQDTFLPRLDS